MTLMQAPPPVTDTATLQAAFDKQYAATRHDAQTPLQTRLDRLQRLSQLLEENETALTAAVNADFGMRSPRLTQVADLFVLRAEIGALRRHTARWMKPRKVRTPIYLQPAGARIERQPLGVVGIIGPWNYPLQLTLGPMATALAAGNRVMLKPSEFTPQTSQLLAQLVAQYFAADEAVVALGGAEMGTAFAALPLDHLLFTGSTAVGRKVAEAAARNLTPVTLELGGKSPCIIDPSCTDLEAAALKVAHGKLLNAGQTCIAPDYLLLPEGLEAAFTQALRQAVARLFPFLEGNPDYAAIVSDRHLQRLHALLDEARAAGAQVVDLAPGTPATRPDADAQAPRQMRPVIVSIGAAAALTANAHALRLMQEEIFGPILPVLTYASPDQVTHYINARPRPLALYWFGSDTAARDRVLQATVSGGVTVNDTLMHVTHDNLPFGGVGDSGIGAYHGEAGFLRFCHQKSVFIQSPLAMSHLFYPPYGTGLDKLLAVLRRIF